MKNNIIVVKTKNQPLRVDVSFIQDWNGFDILLNFIKSSYSVTVLKQADGPDARRCVLEINGKLLELIHDDMLGNYLIAPSKESEPILYDIGYTLKNQFKV
jgi:hypothetical protein